MQKMILKIADVSAKAAGDQWSFTGVASTPAPDRQNDTVDPQGARFKLPLPLLWQHDSTQPVGQIIGATVDKSGITVDGKITQPNDDMPLGLQSRLREAWASIKTALVRGLSIGFLPLEYTPNKAGGFDISAWDWLELSLVTVPAQSQAAISHFKSVNPPIATARGGFALRVPPIQLRT